MKKVFFKGWDIHWPTVRLLSKSKSYIGAYAWVNGEAKKCRCTHFYREYSKGKGDSK